MGDDDRERRWKRESSSYLYRSRWFHVRQDELILPSGEPVTFTVVEHPGYTMVVPLLSDGRVVMERVYRHSFERALLECPSGGLDGDPPEVAARRELEEETGYRAGHLEPLGTFAGSSGISDEQCHLFLATELTADGTMARESTEEIEVVTIPLMELREMIFRGELVDGPSALCILLTCQRVGC